MNATTRTLAADAVSLAKSRIQMFVRLGVAARRMPMRR
jgi:hypothetical protein